MHARSDRFINPWDIDRCNGGQPAFHHSNARNCAGLIGKRFRSAAYRCKHIREAITVIICETRFIE